MRSRGMTVSFLVFILALLCPRVTVGQDANCESNSLRLRLSIAKQKYGVGEPILVKVELSNDGREPIFVGSQIPVNETWIYRLTLGIDDEDGNSSPGLWGGRFVAPPDPKDSFASALAKAWIALPAGYSYGTTIEIDSDMFEFLKKPGRYRLRAKYVSLGMDVPLYYNAVAKKPEEMAKLPFAGWKGETEGNSLWIEIGPPNTGEKQESSRGPETQLCHTWFPQYDTKQGRWLAVGSCITGERCRRGGRGGLPGGRRGRAKPTPNRCARSSGR